MTRRDFIKALACATASAEDRRRPVILLRSSWQTENIGDIAHTPGVLAILEKHVPQADVILWPGAIDRGVEPMLRRRFPKLRIARADAEVSDAFRAADLFLHGSAAGISAAAQLQRWRAATKKPYGFFGITFTPSNDPIGASSASAATLDLLNGAAFVFTRETQSLANLKAVGVTKPEIGFAPDGTFSCDVLDERTAEPFLRENRLEAGKFLCVVPRLRYTPYWTFRKVSQTPGEIARRKAVNETWAEADHAKLRAAVVAWVRNTGGRVLLCPEMTYALDVIAPLLYDPLPADVKPKVVRRTTYWLPDEASSVYRRAALVISSECHSPILAASHGTPCMYARQPEDGIKGQMWKDIGLGEWLFEIEETAGAQLAARALEILASGEASRKKVRDAVAYARARQAERCASIEAAAII